MEKSPLTGELNDEGAPPASQPTTPNATTMANGTQNMLRSLPVASNCLKDQRR